MIDDGVSNAHQKIKEIAGDSFEDKQDEVSILPVQQSVNDGWDTIHMCIFLSVIEADGWLTHVIVDEVIVAVFLIFLFHPFLKIGSEAHSICTNHHLH